MLKRINDEFYQYFAPNGMFFTFKCGERGVYGSGKSWYLAMMLGGQKTNVASFVIEDDGYECYKKDTGHKLWTSAGALVAANEMVSKMISE